MIICMHCTAQQTAELDRVAREAYASINRHLMDVLLNKRQFEKHCTAIKRYLLLGQGDFIQVECTTGCVYCLVYCLVY